MTLFEQFVRRCAKRTTLNGEPVLVTDGDPMLVEAFVMLGYTDPQPADRVAKASLKGSPPLVEAAMLPKAEGR